MATSSSPENLAAERAYWENLVSDILQEARQQGATAADVSVSKGIGFSVTARMGVAETVEYHRDKGIGVTVYVGQRKGSASTSDISPESIKSTVSAACSIARLTSEDPYAGLADPQFMATQFPDLDLYHPWAITPDQAIDIAIECEAQARAVDKRIVNSEGATIGTSQGIGVYGNSHGFVGGYATSTHSISCAMVAQDAKGMQRDGYYTVARHPEDLMSIAQVAKLTGERTVKRLGGRRLKTMHAPVIFAAEIARGLIGSFLGAISGGNLYRKSSFLLDHLNQPVFAKHIQISERPFIPRAFGSSAFDAEGVATHDRELIIDGVLQGYLLGSYSARKLGMQTTGNAGGSHNILINTENYGLEELLKKMDTGLLVTELMGQGVNIVTGDYSRGAAGFWVEKGIIQYPVEEITIAGNLAEMYKHLVAVANDIDHRGSVLTGSILIEKMMIAGE